MSHRSEGKRSFLSIYRQITHVVPIDQCLDEWAIYPVNFDWTTSLHKRELSSRPRSLRSQGAFLATPTVFFVESCQLKRISWRETLEWIWVPRVPKEVVRRTSDHRPPCHSSSWRCIPGTRPCPPWPRAPRWHPRPTQKRSLRASKRRWSPCPQQQRQGSRTCSPITRLSRTGFRSCPRQKTPQKTLSDKWVRLTNQRLVRRIMRNEAPHHHQRVGIASN